MNQNPAPTASSKDVFFPRKIEKGPWSEWFAWYPVRVGSRRVWLKKVYRRRLTLYTDLSSWEQNEYGDVFDILK